MEKSLKINSLINIFKTITSISKEAEIALSEIAKITRVEKNQDLQSIGQTCKTIYFVSKGIARIYYIKEGKDVTEYFAQENEIIIRAESLFTGKASQKGIQALEDTTFISIPSAKLFSLFDQHREIERLFRILIESAYVDTVIRMEAIQFHSAEERYRQLLFKNPSLINRISLKHIASYLGITQVSLSRIRASLR